MLNDPLRDTQIFTQHLQIEESNREETEDVLAYIEELCIAIEPPGGPLLVDIPSPSMDSGELSK